MKPLAFVTVAAVLALGKVAPAWAHTEISPSSVPTGRPLFLTLSAANEKSADLTRISLTAPEGLGFGHATREPSGWAVNATTGGLTWTGGAVEHDHFESWGFEIEGADQPGTRSYRVTLGYADGSSDEVEVPITISAGSAATGTTDTTGGTGGTGGTTQGTVGAATESDGGGGEGRANVALAISVVALVAAVTAAVLAARRGRASTSDGPRAGQDW
jgi:hypothetical protein